MNGLDSRGYVIDMPSGFNARQIALQTNVGKRYYIRVNHGKRSVSLANTQETIDTLQNGTHTVYKTFQFWDSFQKCMETFIPENIESLRSMILEDGEYNWEWISQKVMTIIWEIVESQEESDDV